jgi:hypothetical protein
MEIVVQSSKVVKPAYGEGSTPAVDVVIPLTVFDEVHDEYMSSIHGFHSPSPTPAALEAGLARALAEYREWARRLIDADGRQSTAGRCAPAERRWRAVRRGNLYPTSGWRARKINMKKN